MENKTLTFTEAMTEAKKGAVVRYFGDKAFFTFSKDVLVYRDGISPQKYAVILSEMLVLEWEIIVEAPQRLLAIKEYRIQELILLAHVLNHTDGCTYYDVADCNCGLNKLREALEDLIKQ